MISWSRRGADAPIHFEIYYRETSNARPITYELTINKDDENRPYVEEERLRQRRQGNSYGRPLSFLYLIRGQGYAFEGTDGGQEDGGRDYGRRVEVEMVDPRKLGIVTLGAMKQYSRIEKVSDVPQELVSLLFYAGRSAADAVGCTRAVP